MTATPIPRTLALAAYGDLDFTLLRELPRGRRPIETFVCSTAARARAGLRADPRGAARRAPGVRRLPARRGVRSCSRRARRRPSSSGCAPASCATSRSCCCTARCRPAAKQAGDGARSRRAAADVLVATSVIEVGIDVPNATVMLVEDADRYGISQLHQLRGRIGRGEHASLCLLFGSKDSPRLRALRRAHRRLRARRDRPRAARRGRAGRHAPARAGAVPRRRAAARRGAARARARSTREAIAADDPELRAPEHALLADALLRGVRRRGAGADPGVRVDRAASFGGRTLVAPRGRATRPTLRPRPRGAVLDPRRRATGARVLDLFAGRARSRSRRSRAGRAEADARRLLARPRCAAIRRNLERARAGAPRCAARARCAFLAAGTRRRASIRSGVPRSSIPPRERARAGALGGAGAGARAGRPGSGRERPAGAARARRSTLLDERRYGDTLIRISWPPITASRSVPARSTRSRTATST